MDFGAWRGARRIVGLSLLAAVAVACVAAAVVLREHPLWATVAVFLVSLLGAHTLAFITRDRPVVWKLLGVGLEATAIVALLAAVSALEVDARQDVLQKEFAGRKLAQQRLLYQARAVVVNDCDELPSRRGMYTPSPEPRPGACDRLRHYLPQIEYQFAKETSFLNMRGAVGVAENLARMDDIPAASGSWRELRRVALEFSDGSKRTVEVLEEHGESVVGAAVSASGGYLTWHYVLAVVLAFKLAGLSFEALQYKMK